MLSDDSKEKRVIFSLYKELLLREPNPEEFHLWIERRKFFGWPEESIKRTLLFSEEYKQVHQNKP
jgi:hypothetical protein